MPPYLAILALFVSAIAYADPEPVRYDYSGNPIYLAKDLENPRIYNGTKAKPGELLEVGWIGNCTATLVAPNVVFTAGHCKGTGSSLSFKHQESGRSFSGRCTRHPSYNSAAFNDYALCKLEESVPEGSHMASFDTAEAPLQGEDLLMNGYGQPNLVNLYWGKGIVRNIRSQDIVTCGPSNLGSGDSGGSLFRWADDRSNAVHRKIVGVNSRAGGGCSYFNRVSHSNFIDFARSYEFSNSVQLCGLGRQCDVPPEPLDCAGLYVSLGECYMKDPLPIPSVDCQATYRKFAGCILK